LYKISGLVNKYLSGEPIAERPMSPSPTQQIGANPVANSQTDFEAFTRAAKWEPALKEPNIEVQ
jgi:hypothetical protein